MFNCIVLLIILFFSTCCFGEHPVNWQIGFQQPATDIMEDVIKFHDFLLIYIIGICIFVAVLMFYTIFRFHHKKNHTPSKTTHNNMLEVAWTIIPVCIVLSIMYPSLKLLYKQETIPEDGITLKVEGYQWYWRYGYPDEAIAFDSYMKQDKDLKMHDRRLLSVDNPVVVPVDTNIKVLLTGADVIHSWTVPAFGIKDDAVPGRLNQIWFNAKKTGKFYGQCSELCGINHGFMPIEVLVVTKEEYKNWLKKAKKDFSA